MKIPTFLVTSFRKLVEVPDGTFSHALDELGQIKPGRDYFADIEPPMLRILGFGGSEVARELVKVIQFALFNFVSKDESAEEFCSSVSAALTETTLPDSEADQWVWDEANVSKATDRIRRLLKIDALRLSYKTVVLANFDDRLFLDCRLVTDIRPVFIDPFVESNGSGTSDLAEDEPIVPGSASLHILVHTLRINYRDSDEVKSSHFCLDGEDIDSLIRTLRRAKLKIADLKRNFETKYDTL